MYVSQFPTHFQNTYRQQEQGEQKPLAGSPQDPTNMQELKNSQLE